MKIIFFPTGSTNFLDQGIDVTWSRIATSSNVTLPFLIMEMDVIKP